MALLGLLSLSAAGGCASYRGSSHEVSAATLAKQPGWVRLDEVELVRQKGIKDCGSAALSTVLEYLEPRGHGLDRQSIESTLREKPGEGLTAGQLRDYAKARGFDAFVIKGSLDDLQHEIDAGRPVIVGVHKPLSNKEVLAHYEVVVGYHSDRGDVLTLDPSRGLRRFDRDGFLAEWESAGMVTLVVMPKEQPAGAAPSAQLTTR